MQIQYTFNKNDEYYTPCYAIYPILKRIPKGSTIWCPFDNNNSEFVKVFSRLGYKVKYSNLFDYNENFFDMIPPHCDYIISCPPPSKRDYVFKRLFEIDKPFAMLINPYGTFDSTARFNVFKDKEVQMLYLYSRVKCKNLLGEEINVPYQSAYLCYKILDNQIEFDTITCSKYYHIY